MKLMSKKLLAATAIISAVYASITYADSFQGTASATIVDKINIREHKPLSFGSFSVGAAGGKITSEGSVTDGDILYIEGASKGIFALSGRAGQGVDVFGDSTVTLTGAGGSMTATLTYPDDVTLGADTTYVDVTGELAVPGGMSAGQYTGTYNLTVNYN